MQQDTVNSNLDFTYTNLAPLSQPAEDALESGLNPNQFVFAQPEAPEGDNVLLSPNQYVYADGEPEDVTVPGSVTAVIDIPEPKRKVRRRKARDDDTV